MPVRRRREPPTYYAHPERSSAGCDGWSPEFARALRKTGATRVALGGPEWSDLSKLVPFADQIEELFLDCRIADHSHLELLPRLHRLSLGYECNPQDIDFGRLKGLERLGVRHSTDQIGAIEAAPSLTRLDILNCRLRDLTRLRGLNKLEHLLVEEAPLQSLDGIEALPALRKLTLLQVPLRTLDRIQHAVELRELRVFLLPRLESIAALAKLKQLSSLSLERVRKIRDLSTVGEIASLEDLHLESLPMPSSLDFIGQLARLKKLKLKLSGRIPSLRLVLALKQLEVLHLGQKLIVDDGDLSVLLEMPALETAVFWDRSPYSHRREEIRAALEVKKEKA
jgi:internalin A